MNRIARLVGLALLLCVIFSAAALASWIRLRHQTALLRQTAEETRVSQLKHALNLSQPQSFPWTDAYLQDLGAAIDARISVLPPGTTGAASSRTAWRFTYPIPGDNGRTTALLLIEPTPPASSQLAGLYRHTALVLLSVALGLMVIFVAVVLFTLTPQFGQPEADDPRNQIHREVASLTHLAKVSVSQQAQLEHERNERLRADEDAHFQQVLLNRALEEKIQLGRELHDGIIQSLYATGLTLETAKKHLSASPADAARELDAGLKSLNTTIRDVRSYINGLAPENTPQQDFAAGLQSLTQSLDGGRNASFDLRVDPTAAARLTSEQTLHLMQIIREAVSNSLRHGNATKVTVRLHENGNEVGLLIQDNGKGFDPGQAERGRGLDNIQARASRIQATARVTSTAGEGTRVVLTVPVTSMKS